MKHIAQGVVERVIVYLLNKKFSTFCEAWSSHKSPSLTTELYSHLSVTQYLF
jgi:hypothetical protein